MIPKPKEVSAEPGEFSLGEGYHFFVDGRLGAAFLEGVGKVAAGLKDSIGFEAAVEVAPFERGPYTIVLGGEADVPSHLPPGDMKELGEEGYLLEAGPRGAAVQSPKPAGAFYGVQTLLQLLEDGPRFPALLIKDWPDIALRGIHFDLKGAMPKFEYLKEAIEKLARYKLNAVLVEYEDKFQFEKHPDIASPIALSRDQVRELVDLARDNFVQVIPLVQSLGHAEYVLRHERYRHLQEHPESLQQYCPLKPGTLDLFRDLFEELSPLHDNTEFFHIGADETWQLGRCGECGKAASERGKIGLYIDYISKVCRIISESGKRPILWDDMLRGADPQDLRRLPEGAVLMYWIYHQMIGEMSEDTSRAFPFIERYEEAGLPIIGASAAKGADGEFSNCPHFSDRLGNIMAWGKVAWADKLLGAVSTAWSRYSSLRPPVEPFELMWYTILGSAEYYWSPSLASSRADFNSRFVRRFFGTEDEGILKAMGILDSHVITLARSRSRDALGIIERFGEKARRNRTNLRYLEFAARMQSHLEARTSLLRRVEPLYPDIVRGTIDPTSVAELREMAKDFWEDSQELQRFVEDVLGETMPLPEVEDYIATRFLFEEKLVGDVLGMLPRK
ncbi:MAG: beta-N-acetylhexosaminidase [bacterium]